jgi:hypothetical protein
VLLRRLLNNLQRVKGSLFEVPLAIHGADVLGGVCETAFVGYDVGGFDLSGEETTGQRVVYDDVDLVLATERDELGLNCASCLQLVLYCWTMEVYSLIALYMA